MVFVKGVRLPIFEILYTQSIAIPAQIGTFQLNIPKLISIVSIAVVSGEILFSTTVLGFE
jgi:hypothetical protein